MILPVSVLLVVTSALERLGIPYVLVGSFASSMYGLYRATADIDIVADIKAEQVKPLYDVLGETFYVDELAMRKAVSQKRSFNAIHYESVFKVDIFVPHDDFTRAQLDRGQSMKLSPDRDEVVYVATAEDTVLAKLRWFRIGNESSTNQWKDVLGILATRRDSLDREHLNSWAKLLGVDDLLERALGEAQTQDL
jgi:hypothetical protein